MNNKKIEKGKASINKKKLSLMKRSKIIEDSEDDEVKEKEKGIKKKIKYPKEDNSYDSLSTDKTEETYIGRNKKKNIKNSKSVKKSVDKKKNITKRYSTISKESKKKEKQSEEDDENHINKGKNKKKKDLDIIMRDETNRNIFESSSLLENKCLPCRILEQEKIYNYIKRGLETNGNYNSLYIAGMPGTGKTACVKRVIEILEEELLKNKGKKLSFTKLFLCGTEFPNMANIYRTIYKFIFSDQKRTKKKNFSNMINKFFRDRDLEKPINLVDPTNSHIVLVVDEIDFLINKGQTFLYNLFNWSTYENSKLIIISISNTLDLPTHLFPKIRSRMGNNIIMFKPYDKDQLIEIIKSKGIEYEKFSDDAIKLSCMKISSINGDLRRIIQILLRAKELFNLESTRKSLYKKIDKEYILKAYNDLFSSKLKKVMESLNIYEKIILGAILFKMKDNENKKINIGQLYDKMDFFFRKYNDANKKKILELYWEEYKMIIYNLVRLQLLTFCEGQKNNFMENYVNIEFYVDEFVNVYDGDKDLKPILDLLN